jgi:ABC-2 type transport system ATP-binding protein
VSVIDVADLTKRFRYHQKEPGVGGSLRSLFRRQSLEKLAVDAIAFKIDAGEIVGFLGPNGAGKTTTLKMLCGLIYPSSGQVSVLGHVPSRREPEFLGRIALVMGQRTMLTWDLPAMDTLLLQKEMYELPSTQFRQSVDELAAMLQVESLLRIQVRKLSLGERMKMELLAALVHRPDVLFLDEPTIGLDVVSQQRVRDFLRELNQARGTTVLLTSHYMDDIEALCPRVLVIDHGRIHFDGRLAALVERSAPYKRVRVIYADPVSLEEARGVLGNAVTTVGDGYEVSAHVPRDQVATAVERLLHLGPTVDLGIDEVPVEEIIRELFKRQEAVQ